MARAPDVPASRARARAVEYAPLVALVLLAIAISVIVHHEIFPAYSWNRDEVVYLWQIQGLAEGKALTSGGDTPLFFQPWLSGLTDDGRYFSQYTLGWPLVLLAGDQLLGSAAAALAFGAALAVLGTYAFARELTRDRRLALVAAAVTVLSPLLVVQSGMYLGYLFSLGLGGLFGASLLAGLRLRRTWLLVVSGLLVGWLFVTRPFDGLLWAIALVGYAGFAHWHERRDLARGLAWVALGFLPLLVATLAYNRHVTGSFTEFPITAADPLDSFGFGRKRLGTRWTPTDFSPWIAFKGVGRNGWELPPFLFGSYIAVALTAVGVWLRRRDRTSIALLAIAAVFPIGYFFFWGISLSASFAHVSGPIYFIPLLLPVSILVAAALLAAWRRSRALALGAAVVLVVATVPFLADRLDTNRRISEAQVPWRDAAAQFEGRSLVIVERSGPYLLHLNPFSENPPDLDGRILYATDRGVENLDLIARHPGRTPYFERTDLTTEQTLADFDFPEPPTITVTPIEVERGPELVVRARVTNPGDESIVVATLQTDSGSYPQILSSTATEGETFDVEWRLSDADGAASNVLLDGARGTIAINSGVGSAPEDLRAVDQVQLSYRIDGGGVEVLTPGRSFRWKDTTRGPRLRRADSVESLAVTVTPAP